MWGRWGVGWTDMRKTLLVLAVVAFAIVGADPAAAQHPCEPSCLEVSSGVGAAVDVAALAPAFLAVTAFLLAPRSTREGGGT